MFNWRNIFFTLNKFDGYPCFIKYIWMHPPWTMQYFLNTLNVVKMKIPKLMQGCKKNYWGIKETIFYIILFYIFEWNIPTAFAKILNEEPKFKEKLSTKEKSYKSKKLLYLKEELKLSLLWGTHFYSMSTFYGMPTLTNCLSKLKKLLLFML